MTFLFIPGFIAFWIADIILFYLAAGEFEDYYEQKTGITLTYDTVIIELASSAGLTAILGIALAVFWYL